MLIDVPPHLADSRSWARVAENRDETTVGLEALKTLGRVQPHRLQPAVDVALTFEPS